MTHDRSPANTDTEAPTRHRGGVTGGPAPANRLLALQRSAGNQVVLGMLSRSRPEQVQRLWDPVAHETSKPEDYASLLKKMEGMTEGMGRSRLAGFAERTESAAQLTFLLNLGVGHVDTYLKSIDADTLEKLMLARKSNPVPAFFKLLDDLIKFKVDAKAAMGTSPPATFEQLKGLVASAKPGEGLISFKGTEIVWTTVTGVSGDKILGEKAAVLAAVKALDKGELVGSAHGNNQGNLPGRRGTGGYTEYDVAPPPRTTDRGSRRLVVHNTTKRVYYTWNHYGGSGGTNLPCFQRIR